MKNRFIQTGFKAMIHPNYITMKPSYLFGIMALLIWACSSVKPTAKTSASLIKNSQDSTEYDIVILDPQFDQWYLTNYNPAKDFSLDYYRSKNLIAVANWNNYYRSGRYTREIDSSIDYQPNIDYGIEVNRKLFWYFKYLEDNYRIRLLW